MSHETDELERLWLEQPEIIRNYIDSRSKYEQLVSEVQYILRRGVEKEKIGISAISGRVKTLKSIAEKILRKDYENPLSDITDFAGVRCVYLYLSQRAKIEKVIEADFNVIEKIDKVEKMADDEFGYGALHYIVKLAKAASGARYDDLKDLKCEIQVRTVLQDAWAIIDHHLIYKKEQEAPRPFRRKLNSLAGLFETADSQFDLLREEREKYAKELTKTDLREKSHDTPLDLDVLWTYLAKKFPSIKPAPNPKFLSAALNSLLQFEYKGTSTLDELLDRTAEARDAIRANHPVRVSVAELNRAIALVHPERLKTYKPEEKKRAIEDAKKLIKQK
ncbi:MAG: hypothetical protein H3C27_15315 [Opitutaceae bacterium]|nr:hypothetical protein [Opitutaceae bacterium]